MWCSGPQERIANDLSSSNDNVLTITYKADDKILPVV